MRITESKYHRMENEYRGYCPDCDKFTREMTEPDADGYDCPECGGMNVKGVMNALFDGDLEFR